MAKKLTPRQLKAARKKFEEVKNKDYSNLVFTPRKIDENDPLLKEMLEAVRTKKTKYELSIKITKENS